MKHLILTLAFLGLFQSVQAEILESNITIQIKLYYQKPNQEKNGQIIRTTAVKTIKTSDLIAQLAEGSPQNFSSKALLLSIYKVNADGFTRQLVVREKGKTDLLLSNSLLSIAFASDIPDAILSSIEKGKFSLDALKESSIKTGYARASFSPAPEGPVNLVLHGVLSESMRAVASKEVIAETLYPTSRTFTGTGTYDLAMLNDLLTIGGYAQATIKYSTPKVLPTP